MAKIIDVSFPGGKRVDTLIDKTLIKTDQSIRNGGEAAAPKPFQLFLASIATCAGIYALEFCQAQKLSLEGLSLQMRCDMNPKVKRYTRMTIDLRLPEGFPEKLIPAIIKSMNLCSVERHIIDAPEFVVKTTRQ
jgi:ribosomal protein S12 methylthiotransferase accessory factor